MMNASRRITVLIMAGGTGGHVYPALAVAQALLAAGSDVIWLGVRQGLEAEVVPRAGIRIFFLRLTGLRRRQVGDWLLAPFRLAIALGQAIVLMVRIKPHIVLGMGGFVAGPGGVAAWLLRRPLLIHEQNSVPGVTNRLLARIARCVMEAFPGSFPSRFRARHTGNPVRGEVTAVAPPSERFAGRNGPLRVLVLGGSQGAQILNEVVPAAIAGLPDPSIVTVWHQAGAKNLAEAQGHYRAARLTVTPVAYIEDMGGAYAWADVVVCRAGAMTVSELAAAGAASVLVPYPYAVDDHQTGNARYLSDIGAAVLLPQGEFNVSRLQQLLIGFHRERARLLEMAESARRRAIPDATDRVVGLCMEVAGG